MGTGSTVSSRAKEGVVKATHTTYHDLESAVLMELKFILYARRNHKVILGKEMNGVIQFSRS